MNTENPTANYKIRNERLIQVTEKAATQLGSLLEEKREAEWQSSPVAHICSFELACSIISMIIKHVDGATKKRARFYPARATRERDYAEHARNPKSFRIRQSDFGNAVHRRTRAKRLSRPPCPQGPGVDYSSHESQDHRYSDLRADPGRDVD